MSSSLMTRPLCHLSEKIPWLQWKDLLPLRLSCAFAACQVLSWSHLRSFQNELWNGRERRKWDLTWGQSRSLGFAELSTDLLGKLRAVVLKHGGGRHPKKQMKTMDPPLVDQRPESLWLSVAFPSQDLLRFPGIWG
jgi:hypothetical protein